MDKYIYDESNGLWYELQGDYYTPCLTLPAEKEHKPIGLWGHRHKRYLQEHKRAVYITLLTSGKLNEYLADVDKQAEERFERLVEQMKQSQDITEQLKSENALEWVQKMNNIRACAIEVINNEIIYA
ncbi:MAG TPA: TnpV protein [Candidatus Limousia pullorum]|uniref:TnpV protein n=1 Tax=Candidatus Limousia pullorum TaxID=2840860 RepID=A0A9D1S7L5_9FIRM|nr:TnpV protein [Candidatus Limousia pullorum]